MPTQLQLRRGNTAQTSVFTGATAEITIDTDKKTLVVHDGSTAGGVPLAKESVLTATFVQANAAFDKANSSNVIAQAAFDKANQTAQLAFTTVSANGTNLVADANNDTLTITSAVANGVFVSGNSSTDTLDIGLINSGVTASGYGDSISVPTFVVDAKGRLTSASNTSIRSGTTSQTGIVQLQDSFTSTSTSNAATPASVKTTYDLATTANTNAVNAGTYANAAFDKANSANVLAQSGYNQANTATTTAGLAYTHANGAFDKANTATTTVGLSYDHANGAFNQANTATTTAGLAYTHANGAFDKANSANVLAQSGYNQANTATTTAGLAYTHANGAFDKANTATTTADAAFTKANSANVIAQAAFDNSNTKFNSSGGSITGDVSVTGNLTIIGQTIYANTTTALIADNIITLNAAINQASAPTVDAGFEIDRGSSANVSLLWNETSDKWTFTNDGTNYLNIADAGRLDSSFTHANSAFTTANSATTTAQNAYNLANGTAGVANTDFTTLTASAGIYGNTSHVPVTTLTANGRVSLITNTAIAIDTAALTSGTLADARLPATGTAGTYANAAYVPVITTDSKGRVTAITNTAIVISAAAITSGTLAVAQGGTGVTTSTGTGSAVLNTAPTLSLPVINNIKQGYSNTATAAGTTTLTSASNHYQRFTGSTTQTITLPVTSTLTEGMVYAIENQSTGNLTVNSSGGNLVATVIPGVTVQCMCIGTTLTTAADWDAEYNEFNSITGTGAVTLNTSPTLINVSVTSVNVTNTTASTSNTTGALKVAGGVGVTGNVYADAVYSGGQLAASIGDALSLAIALG